MSLRRIAGCVRRHADKKLYPLRTPVRQPTHVRAHTDGTDPVLWLDRVWNAEQSIIPWLNRHVDLEGKRVVEYGCGDGQVSRSIAPYVRSVVGLDIDKGMVERGRRAVDEAGIENVDLQFHPLGEIMAAFSDLQGEVDLVLLYAVLEHLSIRERLDVLRASQMLARPNGHIVVVESPNRLVSFDGHSSHLPYLNWLPDELARQYADRSSRRDFREQLLEARSRGPAAEAEWWTRFGRGLSFHEFELVFGDIEKFVLAGDYETVLWPSRPLLPEELPLAQDLGRQRPDLGPLWSRHWLDIVLSPVPIERPRRFVRPWVMNTENSQHVVYAPSNTLGVKAFNSRISVTPGQPTCRIVVGFLCSPGEAVLTVERDRIPLAEVRTNSDSDAARYIDIAWDEDVDHLDLRMSTDGRIILIAPEW
ncbi:MAG: class I SAM-dependent methyltransferase [Acidimicrobiaceae bacterium]|nr:class I SAM-dependent methyltransferase [Acidimicrobiaceae bacterium]